MTSSHFDTIVVGLGAVGSACLYQLAKRGQRVLGIDRYHPPHSYGSSHGETRITRQAIGEGEAYVPLVLRSHEIWRELEADTGLSLLETCGALIMGDLDGAACHHGKTNFTRRTIQIAERFGIAHEVLDAATIQHRFPQFRLTGRETGYFEPGGGYVHPERCIEAQLAMARRHGAVLQLDTQVIGQAPDGPHATAVTTARGERFTAAQVVLAAGPWTGGLTEGVGQHLRVCRQVLHWFPPDDPAAYALGRIPVFIWMHGDAPEDYIYGFPIPPGAEGVKLATEQYAEVTDNPDQLRRDILPAEQAAMYTTHIQGRLRGIGAAPLRSTVCMYTVTPDSGFVVDWLPGGRTLIASACSGHGFKHSAGLGEAVAQALIDGGDGLAAFAADRLGRAA